MIAAGPPREAVEKQPARPLGFPDGKRESLSADAGVAGRTPCWGAMGDGACPVTPPPAHPDAAPTTMPTARSAPARTEHLQVSSAEVHAPDQGGAS